VAALRACGCRLRVTVGLVAVDGPPTAGLALRALRRRNREVVAYLRAEAATEGD
jgi:hypothetical protein